MAETIDEIAYGRAICPVRALGRGAIIATVLGRTDENSRPEYANEGTGAPGRTRTCDHSLRRRMLYPAELRARDRYWLRRE